MRYHLSRRAVLKWLEIPCLYHIAKDELYELDKQSFRFLKDCVTKEGCTANDSAFIDYCLEEGLLTSETFSLKHPLLVPAPAPSLRYLELQITDTCNMNCLHCPTARHAGSELSPGQVRNALGSFEEMQGLSVIITGGEPLLHTRFEQINEMLPDFFVRKTLFTNGLLIEKEMLTSLKVDELRISIDGLEQSHDSIRGHGSFNRALLTARLALDAGYDVSISTMVNQRNLADFDAMENLFKKMGIKHWIVDAPCHPERYKDKPDFFVGPEEGGKYLGYGFGVDVHSAGTGFGCGRHLMTVTAAGRLAKCIHYADNPVCSLDEGLPAAWRALNPVRSHRVSCNCEYIEACRGGCRYRAEQIEGKGGKDLYRCYLYRVL